MSIVITPAAEKFMRRMVRLSQTPSGGFRLVVKPGGCSGLASEFSVEAEPQPGDTVLEQNGIKVFFPPASQMLLSGVTVDFADTLAESGFVFRDPNRAPGTCGSHPPAQLVNLTTSR